MSSSSKNAPIKNESTPSLSVSTEPVANSWDQSNNQNRVSAGAITFSPLTSGSVTPDRLSIEALSLGSLSGAPELVTWLWVALSGGLSAEDTCASSFTSFPTAASDG